MTATMLQPPGTILQGFHGWAASNVEDEDPRDVTLTSPLRMYDQRTPTARHEPAEMDLGIEDNGEADVAIYVCPICQTRREQLLSSAAMQGLFCNGEVIIIL